MNVIKKIFFIPIILIHLGCSTTNVSVDDSENKKEKCDLIYWQPDEKITNKDFCYDSSDTGLLYYSNNFSLNALASISIKMILDTPKDEDDLLFDKVYLAPAFCRKHSKTLSQDSISIAKQVIYFDIWEVFARQARKEFKQLQDSMKAYNTIGTMYTIEMNDICERYHNFTQVYYDEVYTEKKEGAFERWQNIVSDWLKENEEYATTPEDIQRFITNEPIDPRYKMAPTIIGEIYCF